MSLSDLNAQVASDLQKLAFGAPTWVRPQEHQDGHVYDVVIVGGGQSGLGAAFGFLRERISNILVIDENPAGQEGPWETYARMVTLRTPKHLTAIDYAMPSLTFRAFWEAQHGPEGWEKIEKIPRGDWMNYLRWFRQVLNLPMRNDTKLLRIEPQHNLYRLHTSQGLLLARKVILATGIQGGGEWHVPPLVADVLPPHLYAHTAHDIDFAQLTGKRIAILGGGASAFDNAHHALTEGVAAAHVFVRRKAIPRINPIRQMEMSGMIARYGCLADADKYAVMASFFLRNQPPTNDTFSRAAAVPGFELHLGSPWLSVEPEGAGAAITTPKGRLNYDFLIVSTGLLTDPRLRPELSDLSDRILRWGDVYDAPEEVKNPLIDDHPYLTAGFAYRGRDPHSEAIMSGIYAFNYSALITHGLSASALSGLKYALPKLTGAVADSLFLDDRGGMLDDYYAYAEEEFTADREARP